MSIVKKINLSQMDPNLISGFVRALGPTYLFGVPILDQPYGDSANLPMYATRLYVGTAGDVSVVRWDGTTVIIPALAAGMWHGFLTIQINTAGTTATNILVGN